MRHRRERLGRFGWAGILALVAGMLLLAPPAAGGANPAVAPKPDQPDQSISTPLTFGAKTASCDAKVTLPPEAAADPRVLDLVAADALGWLWQLVDQAAQAAEVAGKEEWWHPYSGELAFKPAFVSDRVVSLLGELWQFTGGAHPNSGFMAENVDRTNGAPIYWSDLFPDTRNDQAMPPDMRRWVHDQIMREKRERLAEGFDAEMAESFMAELGKDAPAFTFLRSDRAGRAAGLTLHFAPYEVGAYVEGSYEVEMPVSVFADMLAPEWRAVFVSRKTP